MTTKDDVQRPNVLGISWDELPIKFRRRWWQATDFNQHPPSPEFAAQMPELLAADQAKLETKKCKTRADCDRGREFWQRAEHRPPCAECLRPASPCQVRCLRSMLHPSPPREETDHD